MTELQTLEELNQKIEEEDFTVVYFSTKTCNVCTVLKPKLQEIITQYFPRIKFVYVDIEEMETAKGEYMVFAVPTILVFIHGKEMQRYSRNVSINQFKEFAGRYYSLLFE